jgi:hypothetical protein
VLITLTFANSLKKKIPKQLILTQVDASIDMKPCDVQLMLKSNTSEPDLELEGSHVGRGSHYYDSEVNV